MVNANLGKSYQKFYSIVNILFISVFFYQCENLFVCHPSITVVQSYFVYWADIESAVVHDGSHRFWSGSKTTRVDGGSTPFALQEDEVSALAGMQMLNNVTPEAKHKLGIFLSPIYTFSIPCSFLTLLPHSSQSL